MAQHASNNMIYSPLGVSIVNAANVAGKLLPPVPAIAILFFVHLLSQGRQAQDSTGSSLFAMRLKGLGLGQFPRLGQNLGHAPQGLFAFLFLFGIGVVVVLVLRWWSSCSCVRHDGAVAVLLLLAVVVTTVCKKECVRRAVVVAVTAERHSSVHCRADGDARRYVESTRRICTRQTVGLD